MKKRVLVWGLCGLLFASPIIACATTSSAQIASAYVQEPTVGVTAAIDQSSQQILITCTSDQDGLGVLEITDPFGNVTTTQVGIVNGQHVENVPAAAKGRYCIHFIMNGSTNVATATVDKP